MDYLVYQLEKAPTTGQLHLQGYVAFKKRTTLKTAGSAISTHAHFTSARGTPAQNKAYCTKADRLQGPWEFGSLPAGHGHRSDLDSACKAIASGASASSLATTAPTTYVHYHRGLKALEFELRPSPKWREIVCHVLWGKTGVGKTRTAFESTSAGEPSPYFVKGNAQWWDGYTGQDSIIFDDFYGQVSFAEMLRLCDGYPKDVPIKGGFAAAQWTKIWFTSNVHPDQWWKGAEIPSDARDGFMRRLLDHGGEIQQM